MNAAADRGSPLGFEAFGTASGLAIVSGALALLVPGLAMLTAALAGLAVAGWASIGARRRAADRLRSSPALLVLGLAAVGFLDPPVPLVRARALLLALGLVPLWLGERRRNPARATPTEGR